VLLQKFTISVNLSIEGTQEFLNSRLLTEAGPQGLLDEQGELSDLEDRLDKSLPGAKRGDAAQRKTAPEVRVPGVAFSPTGRAFCAASTEGLLIYSLSDGAAFDPFDLDIDVTPASTLTVLSNREWLKAMVMAFRLNDLKLVRRVYRAIPVNDIALVSRDVPDVYLARLLRFVAAEAEQSPYLELNLCWLEALLSRHGRKLKERQGEFAEVTRLVQRAIGRVSGEILAVAEKNNSTVDVLLKRPQAKRDGDAVKAKLKLIESGQMSGEKGSVDGDEGDDESMADGEEEWIGLD
jgi:periodic tryptophan protein 2